MKNDILPPQKREAAPLTDLPAPQVADRNFTDESAAVDSGDQSPVGDAQSTMPVVRRPFWRRRAFIVIFVLIAVTILMSLFAYVWYRVQLRPVSSDPKAAHVRITIKSGASLEAIATQLTDDQLIHSRTAFNIYTRLHGLRDKLQAGTYSLSSNMPMPEIIGHLTSGKTDQVSITFLPGATLAENRQVLLKAGYPQAEVDAALNKRYDDVTLFAGKPAGSNLEGYIYGETYQFDSSATVEQILRRTFKEYEDIIQAHHLQEGFAQQGLTLYQGITLASIIQREVAHTTDQKQVAQVFYTRLHTNMPLGSDVTYQYAAKQLGVAPTPDLDSPYNTRKNPGLPPGPIAVPGLSALEAAAAPAAGDYVYFLSGDDEVTYFARTNAEHEANIKNHCQIKCASL
jgi:UPF0755 protein